MLSIYVVLIIIIANFNIRFLQVKIIHTTASKILCITIIFCLSKKTMLYNKLSKSKNNSSKKIKIKITPSYNSKVSASIKKDNFICLDNLGCS